MNSIKEVYLALKQFDIENRLFLDESENRIELRYDSIRSVIAVEDHYAIIINGEEWTHSHLDCDEIYEELLDALQDKNSWPTESEIRAKKNRDKAIIAFGIIMICVIIIDGIFNIF